MGKGRRVEISKLRGGEPTSVSFTYPQSDTPTACVMGQDVD